MKGCKLCLDLQELTSWIFSKNMEE